MTAAILSSILLLPALIFLIVNFPLGAFKKMINVYTTIYAGVCLAILAAAGGIIFLLNSNAVELNYFSFEGLGFGVRVDSLSILMFTMISIIALVVLRFSKNYLDGDPKHRQFLARLAFTIAFVQLLVLSGNLATLLVAWIGTSVGLHQLLLFYSDRKKSRLAARKKFIIARLGDLSLLIAFALIYLQFGNGDLSYIFNALELMSGDSVPFQLELAAIFLVLSAGLKSVQLPFHGWLLDVMETPTPVSALLHAGLLNAGPFLIIRFAYLLDITSTAAIILISMGALSALFGAIVSTTQPTIKTALAYSSIGHMGFSLMACGLGVYSAALLHLVAHSFYKAHAFLSSGSVIEKVQTKNAIRFQRAGSKLKMLAGITVATALFLAIAYLWGVNVNTDIQLLIIAGIIFLGIVSLQINTFDANNSGRSILYLLIGSAIVINCFFLFEELTSIILGNQIPIISAPSLGIISIAISMLVVFLAVVLGQALFTSERTRSISKRLEIHIKNGLYLNQIFDKMMNSLTFKNSKTPLKNQKYGY